MTMMLVEAYKTGRVKIGDYIHYHPECSEMELNSAETGRYKRQVVDTKIDLRYQFAGLIFGQLILVADGVSDQKVFLQGKIGHENGPDALQRYMQECYSSQRLNTKGICLTEPIFKELPEEITRKKYKHWLATPYVDADYESVVFGVRQAFEGEIYNYHLFSTNDESKSYGFKVRPAVLLPSGIQIDENNILTKSWMY